MKLSTFTVMAFVLIGVVPAILTGYLITTNIDHTLKTSGQETVTGLAGLNAIAESRATSIENFFWDINSKLDTLKNDHYIVENLAQLSNYFTDTNQPEFITATSVINSRIASLFKSGEIIEVVLLNPQGDIVSTSGNIYSTSEIGSKLFETDEGLQNAIKNGMYLTDIFESNFAPSGFETLAVSPVKDATNKPVGFIVFAVDISQVYNILQDKSNLGETGEILLGQNKGNYVSFLNQLEYRDSKEKSLKRISYGSELSIPMQQATRGITGAGVSKDYKSEEILADWRPLNLPSKDLQLGVVAKIDTDEAFGPISQLKSLIWSITSGLFILLLLLGIVFSVALTSPIKRLTENVTNITQGNLDVKLRKSKLTEVNDLTDSLNRILTSLKLAIHRTGATKSEIGIEELTADKIETEEKYKILYDASSDAIMTLAPPTWRFTAGNTATLRMFKVKNEGEFTKRNPGQFSPKYQPDGQLSSVKAKKMIMNAMKHGSSFFEWTHKRADGEEFPATVLLSRIHLEGKPLLQATVRDISDRKVTEQKLEDLKSYYAKILGSIVDGVLVTNRKNLVQYVNYSASNMLNMPENKLVGASIFSLILGGKDQFKAIYNRSKRILKPVQYENFLIKGPNEKEMWFSGWVIPLKKNKKFDGAICTIENITSSRKAELEMLDSKQQTENYLQLIGSIIVALDSKGNIKMINRKGIDILGYKKKELEGKNWFKTCIPKNESKTTFSAFKKLIRGDIKAVEYYENPILTKQGKERMIKWHNSLVKDTNGKIIGTLSSGEDITESIRMENILKASEAQFRSLSEASPDCIKLFNLDGKLKYINPGGMKEHRLKKKDIAKWKPLPTIVKEHHSLFIDAFKKAVKGKTTTIEIKHTPKGSIRSWCQEIITPVKDDAGKIIGVVGISRDISHLRED